MCVPRRRSGRLIGLAALALTSACAGVDASGIADAPGDDRAAFCLSLSRALSAVEADGAGDLARDAAEEVLARAPEELAAPARTVVEHLVRVDEGEPEALGSPRLAEALDALRDGAQRTCGPARDSER